MKVKLDENIHIGLVEVFTPGDHDVETVADEDLLGADDATVSRAAAAEDRLIITLDRGFGDPRMYPPGAHAGILVLRLNDHSLTAVKATLERLLQDVTLSTSPAVSRCSETATCESGAQPRTDPQIRSLWDRRCVQTPAG